MVPNCAGQVVPALVIQSQVHNVHGRQRRQPVFRGPEHEAATWIVPQEMDGGIVRVRRSEDAGVAHGNDRILHQDCWYVYVYIC